MRNSIHQACPKAGFRLNSQAPAGVDLFSAPCNLSAMFENIRKYTGLMVVVLVLLFVGLVFLDGGVSKAFNGKPVMEVGDHTVSRKRI